MLRDVLDDFPDNFSLEFDDAATPLWLRIASRIKIIELPALLRFKTKGYAYLRPYKVDHKLPQTYRHDGWQVRNYEKSFEERLQEGSAVELPPSKEAELNSILNEKAAMEILMKESRRASSLKFSPFSTQRGRLKKIEKALGRNLNQ